MSGGRYGCHGRSRLTVAVARLCRRLPTTTKVCSKSCGRCDGGWPTVATCPRTWCSATRRLRHMAAAMPGSKGEFLDIHGVGRVKAEQYGDTFLEAIQRYVTENDVQRKESAATALRGPVDGSEAGQPGGPGHPRGATYDETRRLLSQGLSVAQIAAQRGLSEVTVIGHIERMVDEGTVLDLEHAIPGVERLGQIEEAFDVCGSVLLRPVWEFLGDRFTYDELRLARVYLRQQGRLPEREG